MTWAAHHPRPEPRDTVPASLAICAIAHQQIQRAESRLHRLLGIVAAVAIGALLTLALLHWATPCEPAGSLCALLAWPRRRAEPADTQADRLVEHAGTPAPQRHPDEVDAERELYMSAWHDGWRCGACAAAAASALIGLAAYASIAAPR